MKILLVVATRETQQEFFRKTATGRSIAFNKVPGVQLHLYPQNSRGLSSVYNNSIQRFIDDDIIFVFAHDDLLFLDYLWTWRVREGLTHFDLIGLAGNKRRAPLQPAWYYVDTKFTRDDPQNLSGIVGHGSEFPPKLDVYGPPRQRVKLLDGLFLAIRGSTLKKQKLAFDEQFEFHFYDLDFCRQLEDKGLSCGTWDLSVVHRSYGNFNTNGWMESYRRYIEKWKE
jgi:hypothetical protein